MHYIRQGAQSFDVFLSLNWDRFLFGGLLALSLLGGAYLATLLG